ncbi:ATP-binding protein [Streptomyces maoxianensis]|uniref:ATP-binding protein n=1 Tax=Streptomyces maoxianensis TaxID=1459942 RepID=A0ABV9GAG3_9ACTN
MPDQAETYGAVGVANGVVQEAVTKAVKHARPTRILIELDSDAHNFVTKVTDNGRGMVSAPVTATTRTPPRVTASGGMGIAATCEPADCSMRTSRCTRHPRKALASRCKYRATAEADERGSRCPHGARTWAGRYTLRGDGVVAGQPGTDHTADILVVLRPSL